MKTILKMMIGVVLLVVLAVAAAELVPELLNNECRVCSTDLPDGPSIHLVNQSGQAVCVITIEPNPGTEGAQTSRYTREVAANAELYYAVDAGVYYFTALACDEARTLLGDKYNARIDGECVWTITPDRNVSTITGNCQLQ